MSGYTVNTL